MSLRSNQSGSGSTMFLLFMFVGLVLVSSCQDHDEQAVKAELGPAETPVGVEVSEAVHQDLPTHLSIGHRILTRRGSGNAERRESLEAICELLSKTDKRKVDSVSRESAIDVVFFLDKAVHREQPGAETIRCMEALVVIVDDMAYGATLPVSMIHARISHAHALEGNGAEASRQMALAWKALIRYLERTRAAPPPSASIDLRASYHKALEELGISNLYREEAGSFVLDSRAAMGLLYNALVIDHAVIALDSLEVGSMLPAALSENSESDSAFLLPRLLADLSVLTVTATTDEKHRLETFLYDYSLSGLGLDKIRNGEHDANRWLFNLLFLDASEFDPNIVR